MPRVRRDDVELTLKPSDVEEDYLDVDKPLPGQNYYCISFVSPEKVLSQKEQYMFYHYERAINKKITALLDDSFTKLVDNSVDGNIDLTDVIKLKKTVSTACKEYNVTLEEFAEQFENFKFQNEEKVGEAFDKVNNFRTSVRGVKVRGVFDSKREADVRAAVLQRQDSLFDVFVGQVGYWCPWDPNPQKIDDIEYMNNDLNKLVKEYKSNEVKKDMFYQEQKSQRQKESLSADERLKHQEGIKAMNDYRDSLKEKEKEKEKETLQNTKSSIESSSGTVIQPSLINLNTMGGTTLDSLLNISDGLESPNEVPATPQSITESLELGGENSKEVLFEDETKILMSDDPWIQRKAAEKEAAEKVNS